MSATQRELDAAAQRLVLLLHDRNLRVVFAESCTGGLIAATLSRRPGVSEYLCGSAVVYRLETKTAWLGVSPDVLQSPGPVSGVVAAAMAEGVLARTPHAHAAAAITGHLGPDAPRRLDGVAYAAVAERRHDGSPAKAVVQKLRLERSRPSISAAEARALRIRRQREAALAVLEFLRAELDRRSDFASRDR